MTLTIYHHSCIRTYKFYIHFEISPSIQGLTIPGEQTFQFFPMYSTFGTPIETTESE